MTVEPVGTVGVAGAGFMGSGIAETVARAGVRVAIYEPGERALARSRERVDQSVARAVRGGKLTPQEGVQLVERIVWTTDLADLADADVVIEAVVEDLAVKRELFARLDEAAPDARILASNTSSIPIASLAAATRRPERVCGLHFFSPVPVMGLVELVVGLDTSLTTIAAAEAFAAQIDKHAVRTKDRAGFVVNFLLVPYLMSAVRMLEDGFATREDIDEGMKRGCGHPMGPLTLCDFVGLDVLEAVCDSLYDEFKRPEYAPPALLRRMVAAGRLGHKSGRGFYDYDPARERTAA
ncbi:MAG TPA: 3-hydroxybutyryl-CoA dehydrogenase [Conexibacter sp.]|jgi:3-hydroxybutyryl-CoA dehydrogenase|nr:3-hydroxybutyryl-CoA dehydrogenase [Conexibacter sp.]